ncbi:MAG: VolA/Pla-1 family phospholipase [Photobacterium frigidiphilum]|uniref:VolA/Pla-1 family phospholipase n=1 Tax=Photobacterium frigidiphilum TaxID=264736 RepID=UPI0030037F20
MNKNLLALLIASSLGLYGCGDETSLEGKATIDPDIEKSLKAETKINFDLISNPSSPVIVMPTFLAMDSTDGTLSVDNSAKDPSNLADPQVALGKTDGWSTTQPIAVEFTGNDLVETPAADSFYLIASKDPTNNADGTQPSILSAANGDFVVTTSGKTLTVILTKPLAPSSNYMFAITNALKDIKGNSVGMSNSYAVLKSTNKPPSDALIPAQVIVQATEKEVGTIGVDTSDIIFSSWFTTASVGDVLDTTKSVIAQTIATVQAGGTPESIWKGEANPNNVDLSTLYQMDISEVTDISTFFNSNASLKALVGNDQATIDALVAGYGDLGIKIYTGTVNLPQFLETKTENEAWKKTPWQSAVPSLAKIANIMTNGSNADKAAVQSSLDGIEITKLLAGDSAEFIKLIGLKVTLADGSQLDEERLMTQYSPLPQVKSVAQIPVLMILPPNATPGAVVYQHGITSVKENAYLFGAQHIGAAALNSLAPKAIIAIDHPLHGERALADGTVTTPATADVYMNLEYLTVARDNIRQSIMDSLGVRTSLAIMKIGRDPVIAKLKVLDNPDTEEDDSDVGFFGHSLGAITGVGTYRLGNDKIGIPAADALFNFTSGAFANPGGGIPSLLLESASFGPTIKHSLLMGAKNDAYIASCGSAGDGGTCFTAFFNSLDGTTQGAINATFSSFAYAAQTVFDTVDPYNLAKDVNGPVYVMQAEDDNVVPNRTTQFSIIGGTEPLAAQLGLTDLTELPDPVVGDVKHIARFNAVNSKAQHSTVIGPQLIDGEGNPIDLGTAKAATNEAQLQVATFSANSGKAVVVGNPTLIE